MITHEFKAFAVDTKSNTIPYVGTFKTEAEAQTWFDKHAATGKFQGLSLEIKKRTLFNGKPVRFKVGHAIIALNVVLLGFLIYRLLA